MEDRIFEIEVTDDVASIEVTGSLLETTFGGDTKIEQVALTRLSPSPRNVCRKVATGIDGLADSIAAKGLLQNLVAHPMKGARCKKPKLYVCAGQRQVQIRLFMVGFSAIAHGLAGESGPSGSATITSPMCNQRARANHRHVHRTERCLDRALRRNRLAPHRKIDLGKHTDIAHAGIDQDLVRRAPSNWRHADRRSSRRCSLQ